MPLQPPFPPVISPVIGPVIRLWNRRAAAAALVVMPTLWTGARAQHAPLRRTTPSQTEGPFYPVKLPQDADFDLLRNGALNYSHGQPSWLEGSVSDLNGQPVRGRYRPPGEWCESGIRPGHSP